MAKNSITDYSKTAASNTDIQSVDIDEGCLPSGINNAIRELMADLADMNDGTVSLTSPAFTSVDINGGTIDNTVIGGTTSAAGSFTNLNIAPSSGFGYIEMGGASGAYIDMKAPFSDDYDGRVIHDGSNLSLVTSSGGGNILFQVANQTKMSVISTGIDVTGTVTADGLTVDGLIKFSGLAPTVDYDFNADSSVTSADGLAYTKMGSGIATAVDISSVDTITPSWSAFSGSTYSDNKFRIMSARGNSTDALRIVSSLTAEGHGDTTIIGNVDVNGVNTRLVSGLGISGEDINLVSDSNINFRTAGSTRLDIASNGDISFYEDTGTTARLFWDASAESLGIGTSSVFSPLHLGGGEAAPSTSGNMANNGLTISNGVGGRAIQIGVDDTAQGAYIQSGYVNNSNVANNLFFYSGASRSMTIDSSGNVLVGTTDTSLYNNGAGGNTGVVIEPSGTIQVAKSSNACVLFNRLDSDGIIAGFRKDGAEVGSIGVNGSSLTVGRGSSGVHFYDGGTKIIVPANPSTGGDNDATVDLGYSSGRFKDLYLSGGVYVGGTGSANHLDDYEEGTFTPTFTRGGSAMSPTPSYSTRNGKYTKIGDMVHAEIYLRFNNDFSGGSGEYQLQGLPFTANGMLQGISWGLMTVFSSNWDFDTHYAYLSGTSIAFGSSMSLASTTNNQYLCFTIQYKT